MAHAAAITTPPDRPADRPTGPMQTIATNETDSTTDAAVLRRLVRERRTNLRIDRDRRAHASFARAPRPDVAAALPALGSCAEAGYAAVFPMLPGDDARHDIRVVFRASDGRMRTLSRTFEWEP